jgi:hypothetical protein
VGARAGRTDIFWFLISVRASSPAGRRLEKRRPDDYDDYDADDLCK